MQTIRRINKAVIDVTIRLVVKANFSDQSIDNAVDNFLERALQSNITEGLYTVGFVSAKHVGHNTIHEWEESECKEL